MPCHYMPLLEDQADRHGLKEVLTLLYEPDLLFLIMESWDSHSMPLLEDQADKHGLIEVLTLLYEPDLLFFNSGKLGLTLHAPA